MITFVIVFWLSNDCVILSKELLKVFFGSARGERGFSVRYSGSVKRVSSAVSVRGEIGPAGPSGAVFALLYMRPRPVMSHSRLRAGK